MNATANIAASTEACFHCGEPLAGSALLARIGDLAAPVCCPGCQAVAEMIASSGLTDYYIRRTETAPKPDPRRHAAEWQGHLDPAIVDTYVRKGRETHSVDLLIENLRCAACGWLIERSLSAIDDVVSVEVSSAVGRAHIEWRPNANRLELILETIAHLGYAPHPLTEETTARVHSNERRSMLKRFIVATFGMMQVMMFAVAGYSAELNGERIDPALAHYFRLISLLVSIPVLLYSAKPFLLNAWHNVRTRSIGMDLPVSAALLLAFVASVFNTFRQHGAVYFDSVTMFVFFLTLTRFVELSVRHRTNSVADALARQLPATAQRIDGDRLETVPTRELRIGDIVVVPSGAAVPSDGVIIEGRTSVNEALLTGESLPVSRGVGDKVASGSLNAGSPIRMRVTAVGSDTLLSTIVALLRQAQMQKPKTLKDSNRAAAVFLRVVLIASVIVCGTWMLIDPSKAFAATLALLVVACPCAFSIATPAAYAATSANLARDGVLVANIDAIETLSRCDRVIFDKTGTLTHGEMRLDECTVLGSRSREHCLAVAAALESTSEHPIALAFRQVSMRPLVPADVVTIPGAGIEGTIDDRRYRIGKPAFVAALHTQSHRSLCESEHSIVLGDEHEVLATFTITDRVRDDSPAAVARLYRLGIDSEISSGDASRTVAAVASLCAIRTHFSRRTPEQKLARVHELQHEGHTVAMLGDGINDAPVLGAADVSIAMGRGAALAIAAADLVLVREQPSILASIIATARRTVRIARQNRRWAAAYNFAALPLAALGFVPPWIAALGMSLSSIFVLMNALRLLPRNRPRIAMTEQLVARRSQSIPVCPFTPETRTTGPSP